MFGIRKTINHDVSAGGLTSWPWGRLGSPGIIQKIAHFMQSQVLNSDMVTSIDLSFQTLNLWVFHQYPSSNLAFFGGWKFTDPPGTKGIPPDVCPPCLCTRPEVCVLGPWEMPIFYVGGCAIDTCDFWVYPMFLRKLWGMKNIEEIVFCISVIPCSKLGNALRACCSVHGTNLGLLKGQ